MTLQTRLACIAIFALLDGIRTQGAEQTFARFYNAFTLLLITIQKSPLFLKRKTKTQFKLEENEELKSILLLKRHGLMMRKAESDKKPN
jgi:hypothetical protein